MKQQQIQSITIATELHAVQIEKEAIEAREKELKDQLLSSLKAQGVTFVRLEDGTSFTRSHRESLKIKAGAEDKAFKWAADNTCLKVDTTKAMRILRRELKMPRFFERVKGSDYLTVKRKGDDTNDDE